MTEKSLKIQIEIPLDFSLKTVHLVERMKEEALLKLTEQNYAVSESVARNLCKNALSRARNKGKAETRYFTIYIPMKSLTVGLVANQNLDKGVSNAQDIPHAHEDPSAVDVSLDESNQMTFDYSIEKGLRVEVNYSYLKDTFSEHLSRSSTCGKMSHFVDEICLHCFNSSIKYYVNVSDLRRHISSQISHFIRKAKRAADTKHVSINKILIDTKVFTFYSKAIEPVIPKSEFVSLGYESYQSVSSSDHILIIEEKKVLTIRTGARCLYVTLSQSFATQALEKFDHDGFTHVEEIILIIQHYCEQRKLILNTTAAIDALKANILERRIRSIQSQFFTCIVDVNDQNSHSEDETNFDLDTLLGPVYTTRGTKRSQHVVPLDFDGSDSDGCHVEVEDNDLWSITPISSGKKRMKSSYDAEQEEFKRMFLHIKDQYHITDSAVKALHRFFKQTNQNCYSMTAIRRIREKVNTKIPLKFTHDSAYVPFEFALRTAIFVARKHKPDILNLNSLAFRLNMDGTLMGNKHVVAISVNCIDGGLSCQTARNLVPVGIFEIQKESNELLRKTLPRDFLESIQSVKQLQVNGTKYVNVKVRLGGDFQNAVYVFGLAGVHSNYPCVFCTQHKAYLHVTERNTECEEEVWIGSGTNKRKVKQKVIVNPTSCYDKTLGARSLEEKKISLDKIKTTNLNNELGYQSEPLFGDLFECSDYVIDNLHMRLRIFDILLKDILAEASRTGEYGSKHNEILEEKVEILNQHATKTIGKRFFFKIDTESNVKTISYCGRFSGHLQASFFNSYFPYDKLIGNEKLSKNAKNLIQKFKLIIDLVKTKKEMRTTSLAEAAKSFVKDYLKSGLRTVCTPYMHLIGTHLAEQDNNEHLPSYDMQGVEKSNDLLSRLYFSSSNRAKKPLKTMVETLYRRLEMNFSDPNDRSRMSKYARAATFDDTDSETDDIVPISPDSSKSLHESDNSTSDYSEEEESSDQIPEEELDQVPDYLSKKTYQVKRSEDRWKSFRTS